MIAVIDYDTGNIRNLMKALDYVGLESVLTDNADQILSADGIILPGVGAFAQAMDELKQRNLVPVLQAVVDRQIPLLGICLGMQLLFESSEEFGEHAGLSFLPGKIKKIPDDSGLKIPEMGWNRNQILTDNSLFELVDQQYTYFVHSYYADCPRAIVTASVDYGVTIPSIVEQNNVIGMQFHPEKSSSVGLELLAKFKKKVINYVDTSN